MSSALAHELGLRQRLVTPERLERALAPAQLAAS